MQTILQKRACERNFGLARIAGMRYTARSLYYSNKLEGDGAEKPHKEFIQTLDKLCDDLEDRVKKSYDEFKRKYHAQS